MDFPEDPIYRCATCGCGNKSSQKLGNRVYNIYIIQISGFDPTFVAIIIPTQEQ